MVRNLKLGEELPDRLKTAFESGKNTLPEWIWIVERSGKPVGILVAAPAHIVVIVLRLITTENADVNDVRALLLHFVRTIKERGFNGYYTMVDPEIPAEEKLGQIIEAAGGLRIPKPQYVCAGMV